MSNKQGNNQHTVLYDIQSLHGGKMIDFHGWDMAVQFSGITEEHTAVRTGCGLFDLGHMGRLRIEGPGALDFLQARSCRPLASMKPGQVRYSLILNKKGTVDDDILISRESESTFHIVVNASNLSKVLDLWGSDSLSSDSEDGHSIRNLTHEQAMIAVQGPQSAHILESIGLDGHSLKYYSFIDLDWKGTTVRLSRTGYTGENGFECFVASEQATNLWDAVRQAGATLCGLGCRDTLRLEAGMPLYGNEIDDQHTPVEAGLKFAVGKHGTYLGADIVLAQKAAGTERILVGLKMDGKRAGRHGYAVFNNDGQKIGIVTSGSLSPTHGYPIAMAYIPTSYADIGTIVKVDLRGKAQLDAEVVAMPFYKRET